MGCCAREDDADAEDEDADAALCAGGVAARSFSARRALGQGVRAVTPTRSVSG